MNIDKANNDTLTEKPDLVDQKLSQVNRIDRHYILHEIEHILHVERGIIFTIRELLLRPGKTVQQFVNEDRSRLVKPVTFVLITAILCTFTSNVFHFESEQYAQGRLDKSTYNLLLLWLDKYSAYENIIISAFIAFWTTIFFRKHRYNFFEILVLMCFVQGIVLIIISLFQLIQGVTQYHMLKTISIVALGYSTWAIGQFFGKNNWINYVKSFFAYVFGFVTFFSCLLAIGSLVDFLTKH